MATPVVPTPSLGRGLQIHSGHNPEHRRARAVRSRPRRSLAARAPVPPAEPAAAPRPSSGGRLLPSPSGAGGPQLFNRAPVPGLTRALLLQPPLGPHHEEGRPPGLPAPHLTAPSGPSPPQESRLLHQARGIMVLPHDAPLHMVLEGF
ncbi:hypothetical protein NDU88_011209 [Pleurodeles waltl]|uniref:Uncharacterized protein n=1 Tax=Pleurodeles waltl TaxID=8319 RepID=A0AAV7QY59_PLEWA|nr:hypothetical protein NDU88_011209 [Pleurodeles waltl]